MSKKRIPMFIRSPHRSKVFIGLSMLFVALIIALAAMRADITEAQQNAADFPPSSSPPRAVAVEHHYGLPPVGFPSPPNNQNNPAGSPWYTPPTQSRSNNGFGPQPPMSTAAPMTEGDRRALELANRIRQTRDKEEREQLRSQLRETLNVAFDQRREQQLREIAELEQQLEAIRKLDEKRQQRKEEIVQRRMSELLSEPDALDWEPKRFQGQYGFPAPMTVPQFAPAMPMPGPPNMPTDKHDPNAALKPPAQYVPRSAIIFSNGSTVENSERIGAAIRRLDVNRGSDTVVPVESDAFIYTLTESMMEKIVRLQKVRKDLKGLPVTGGDADSRQELLADESRILSSVESGRSVWRMIGKQKERDVDSAAAALEYAKQRLKIKVAAFEKGNLAQINLMDDEAAVERLNAEAERAKDQLVVWKELDQRLQTALNGVGLSEPEPEAVEKQEDNGPGDASVEQGATLNRLFYDIRICYRVTIWQTIASKA